MSDITDQIVSAGIELGEQIAGNIGNWRAQEQTLREMITAALADAERKGAEAMREAVATWYAASGFWVHSAYMPTTIRALPLPTGERQAVLLTDEQIERAVDGHGWTVSELQVEDIPGMARDIEAAVLAANGLEVRRG